MWDYLFNPNPNIFAQLLVVADFSPFFIMIEIRKRLRSKNQKIRRGQKRRRRRRDLEKCPALK